MNKIDWHKRIDDNVSFLHKLGGGPFIMGYIAATLYKLLKDPDELAKKLKAKFDKGAAEHGGDFADVDHRKEIEDELLDVINYMIGDMTSKD